VLDPVAVDDRVAADHRRDQKAERCAAAAADAAHEEHAGRDDDYARDLAAGRIGADDDDRVQESRDRRQSACDRVDERELEAPVCGGEQCEIHELEQPRGHHILPRARIDVPARQRERREYEDERDRRHRRRRLGVRRPSQQQVPDRVERRRAEREGQRGRRHYSNEMKKS
jgi:hypothetical protein